MYNIVQEYLYFHGTRKVLFIVTVGGGIWSKGDTILFQDCAFKHPFWMSYSYFPFHYLLSFDSVRKELKLGRLYFATLRTYR